MADWTTIPDSSIEPGKPIRSIDGLALRDNPIAISEGAAGAPRIIGNAAKRIEEFAVLTVTAADTYSASVGSNPEPLATATNSTVNVVAYRYTIDKYTGSLRFKISQYCSYESEFGQTSLSTLQAYKNGVLLATYTYQSTAPITRTLDISIVPGDVIEWRHNTNGGGGVTVYATGAQILGSNGYTTRPLYIAYSDAGTP